MEEVEIPIGAHHILFIGGVNKEIFTGAWKREKALSVALESGDTWHPGTLQRYYFSAGSQIGIIVNKVNIRNETIIIKSEIDDDYAFEYLLVPLWLRSGMASFF